MKPTSEEVANAIRDAFRGVVLGNGVGLWEGCALDDYEDANGIAKARSRDERVDWRAIPNDDLQYCESSLTFADPEGVRFLLPAFMIAQLNDKLPVGIVFTLTSYYNMKEHYAALSAKQRKAVRLFLLLLRDDPKYEHDRMEIETSLDTDWKE